MDKQKYIDNRATGKPGQGELPKPKAYKKGEPIKYITREGKKAEYPNARGAHMVRIEGKLRFVNRVEARRKSRSHPATKKNYAYQLKKYGPVHTI